MSQSSSTQATQLTSPGTSDKGTSPQLRIKKKQAKVKEIEATVHHNGSITYVDEEGSEKAYVIDSMDDYHHIMSECKILGKKGFEVSHRMFDMLNAGKNKDTPYTIIDNVFVYREGTKDKFEKLDTLDIEDIIELRAKKKRKETEALKLEKEKFKEEIEL